MKKIVPANDALGEMLARDDDGEWRGSSGMFVSPAEPEPAPPPVTSWRPPAPDWHEENRLREQAERERREQAEHDTSPHEEVESLELATLAPRLDRVRAWIRGEP